MIKLQNNGRVNQGKLWIVEKEDDALWASGPEERIQESLQSPPDPRR
jgi:hypothetical protein